MHFQGLELTVSAIAYYGSVVPGSGDLSSDAAHLAENDAITSTPKVVILRPLT